jgi:hypothetical protein
MDCVRPLVALISPVSTLRFPIYPSTHTVSYYQVQTRRTRKGEKLGEEALDTVNSMRLLMLAPMPPPRRNCGLLKIGTSWRN